MQKHCNLWLGFLKSKLLCVCAVTIWCINSPTVKSMTIKKIHGQDWEKAVAESGIQALSKVA